MKGKGKGKRTLKLSPRKRGNRTEREKFAIRQRLFFGLEIHTYYLMNNNIFIQLSLTTRYMDVYVT